MDKLIYESWKAGVFFAHRDCLVFPENMHDQIEIIIVSQVDNDGIAVMVDDRRYVLCGGKIICLLPNQKHSYGKGQCDGYMAILDSDFLRLFGEKFLNVIPENPVIHDEALTETLLPYFEKAVEVKRDNFEYDKIIQRGLAIVVLGLVMDKLTFKERSKISKNAVNDIFAYCNANYNYEITLDTISKEINVSKSRIVKIFRDNFNTTFNQYITNMRIRDAEKMLASTNKSIAEIATTVGYSSIRSFNRNFLKCNKISPTEYRKTYDNQK